MRFQLWQRLGLFCLPLILLTAPTLGAWGQGHQAGIESPSLLIFGALGFVGSGHCIGMCGPFVMGYSQSDRNHWSSHVLYGLGRSTTYALMGLIASSFGQVLQAYIGFRSVLLVIAGVLMVYLALAELKLFRAPLPSIQGWRGYQRTVQVLFQQTQWYRTYPLGVVLGFIPCGLTAIALSFALTQPPGTATLGMFLFGVGTMPAMVGLGLLIQRLKFPRLQRYIAALMALLGCLTIWLGSYQLGWTPPPPQLALLHQLHPTKLPHGVEHTMPEGHHHH